MTIEILDAAPWPVRMEWPVDGKMQSLEFTVIFKELGQEELGLLEEGKNLLVYNLRIDEQRRLIAANPDDTASIELLATYEQWAQEAIDRGATPLQVRDCVLKIVEGIEPGTVKVRGNNLDWADAADRDLFLSRPGVVLAIWQAFANEFVQRSWVKNSDSSGAD